MSVVGGILIFVAGLGMIHLLWGDGSGQRALREGGGFIGEALSSSVSGLVSAPGAFIVLLGLIVAGLLLLLNVTLRTLISPVTGGGRKLAGALATPARAVADGASARRSAVPVMTDRRGDEPPSRQRPERPPRETTPKPDLPSPEPSAVPLSQTVWNRQSEGHTPATLSHAANAPLAAAEQTALDLTEAEPPERTWQLPSYELLDLGVSGSRGQRLDHERNIRIIEEKLSSFQIPANVVATNTGPVVTQYEVKPDAHIKLSRIEALADDLAMALAARSIRIEAPIPGRDVVGIEIPNHSSEIVAFRRLLDDADMSDAASRLDVRARPRCLGQGIRRRPGAHAASAGRRRDRQRQERLRKRAHHEPVDARHSGRGAPDPDRPQARRAGRRIETCRTSKCPSSSNRTRRAPC